MFAVVRVVVRLIGNLALACWCEVAARVGGDQDDLQVRLRQLRQRGLSDPEWIELAQRIAGRVSALGDGFALPELIELLAPGDGATTSATDELAGLLTRARLVRTAPHRRRGDHAGPAGQGPAAGRQAAAPADLAGLVPAGGGARGRRAGRRRRAVDGGAPAAPRHRAGARRGWPTPAAATRWCSSTRTARWSCRCHPWSSWPARPRATARRCSCSMAPARAARAWCRCRPGSSAPTTPCGRGCGPGSGSTPTSGPRRPSNARRIAAWPRSLATTPISSSAASRRPRPSPIACG